MLLLHLMMTFRVINIPSGALVVVVVWDRVWRIFGYSNIFEYFPIRSFVRIIFVIFVSFFWYKYIRIFIRIVFFIQIYSYIRLYHFFYTNIFRYSFVSFFDTNIFKRKNLTCAPTSPKDKWLKLFTHTLIFIEKLLPLCCVNFFFKFLCCITHQKSNI